MNIRNLHVLMLLGALLMLAMSARAETKVVILGTGTPVPDAERSGPGVAVIHNGTSYVFDAGGGMVQRAIEANQRLGIQDTLPDPYQASVHHAFAQ